MNGRRLSYVEYKIFRLTDQSVDEVTAIDRFGIPDSAIQLFSHYGVKLLCAQDSVGYYELFVNDIHCQERDDMGRSKTCSLLITGTSVTDKVMLRHLAVMIALELDQFEKFFSGLFSIKDNLTFDYKKLQNFIESVNEEDVINEDKLRKALLRRTEPIVIYTTTERKSALTPLYNHFDKRDINDAFLIKWDEEGRKIIDKSVESIGFLRLIQQILNRIASLWKN